MAMTHYFFSEAGNELHKHIKEHNITVSDIADKLTNILLVNCLEKSTPEAWANALKAFKEVKERFDVLSQFDHSIFPDFTLIKSLEDLSKLPYNDEVANKSYEMGMKFRSTA